MRPRITGLHWADWPAGRPVLLRPTMVATNWGHTYVWYCGPGHTSEDLRRFLAVKTVRHFPPGTLVQLAVTWPGCPFGLKHARQVDVQATVLGHG